MKHFKMSRFISVSLLTLLPFNLVASTSFANDNDSAITESASKTADKLTEMAGVYGYYDAADGRVVKAMLFEDYQVNGLLGQLFHGTKNYRLVLRKYNRNDWVGTHQAEFETEQGTVTATVDNKPMEQEVYTCTINNNLLSRVENQTGLAKLAGLDCAGTFGEDFVLSVAKNKNEIQLVKLSILPGRDEVIGGKPLPLVQHWSCLGGDRSTCLPDPDQIGGVSDEPISLPRNSKVASQSEKASTANVVEPAPNAASDQSSKDGRAE